MAVLKAITGQDDLRHEEKGKQAGIGFKAQTLIIISSNE
jgi:putative DNA primase/helicase